MRFIGKDQRKIVLATVDGCLIIIDFDYRLETGDILTQHWLDLSEDYFQELFSLAVCPKGEYICVEINEQENDYRERLVTYGLILLIIVKNNFIRVAFIDEIEGFLRPKMALECHGYQMNHILWIGLSSDKFGTAQIYDYDMDKKEFKELKEKRVTHHELNPIRLSRGVGSCGSSWFYTGELGKVMKLDFKVKDVSIRR